MGLTLLSEALVIGFMLVVMACHYLGMSYLIDPALSAWLPLSMLAVALAGGAWVQALALFNTSVQLSTPRWVVGRALSFYQMCTFGGMRGVQPGEWLSRWSVFGIAMGILAGVLIFGMLFGLKLPLISGYREATLVLACIISSKWVVGLFVRLTT